MNPHIQETWMFGVNAGLLVGGALSRWKPCPRPLLILLGLAMIGGYIWWC